MAAEGKLHQAFCGNVKARRLQLALTQQDVAERMGVSQPSYAAIENGRREPTIGVVERVAEALELPPALLMTTQELAHA